MTLTVILSVLGSNGLFALIQFLISRKDNKSGKAAEQNSRMADMSSKLDKLERDSCRTQLLLMLSDYDSEHQEILKLAKHYFSDLHGDWYMTGIFNRWLVAHGIGKPEWFAED